MPFRFSAVLSSMIFIVLCFIFGSEIYFDMIFVKCVRSFAFEHLDAPVLFVEKTVFAPLCCLCPCIKDQLTICVSLFLDSLFISLIYFFSILSPIPGSLDYYRFIVSLEVR